MRLGQLVTQNGQIYPAQRSESTEKAKKIKLGVINQGYVRKENGSFFSSRVPFILRIYIWKLKYRNFQPM